MLRRLFLLAGWVVAVANVHAKLVWEQTTLKVEAEQGQTAAKSTFKFTNKGDQAVKITSVSTSCGCTVAKPAKEVFAPGEAGELPAQVSVGESAMTRHVSIQVETDEAEPNVYDLSLTVEVAALIQVEPRLLLWKVGAEPEPKAVRLTFKQGVKLTDTTLQGEGFALRVVSEPQGGTLVWVTPGATQERRLATLAITAKRETGEPVLAKVFLRVASP